MSGDPLVVPVWPWPDREPVWQAVSLPSMPCFRTREGALRETHRYWDLRDKEVES